MDTGTGQIPPRPDETTPPTPVARGGWGRRILLIVGALILVPLSIAFWSGFVEGFKEAATRTAEPRRFSDHGLSFEVPEGLHRLDEEEREQVSLTRVPGIPSPAAGEWFDVFALDGSNLLLVFPDPLPWIVDESNLAAHAQLAQIGARDILDTELDVATSTVGGYPSVELGPNEVETPDGVQRQQLVRRGVRREPRIRLPVSVRGRTRVRDATAVSGDRRLRVDRAGLELHGARLVDPRVTPRAPG